MARLSVGQRVKWSACALMVARGCAEQCQDSAERERLLSRCKRLPRERGTVAAVRDTQSGAFYAVTMDSGKTENRLSHSLETA